MALKNEAAAACRLLLNFTKGSCDLYHNYNEEKLGLSQGKGPDSRYPSFDCRTVGPLPPNNVDLYK